MEEKRISRRKLLRFFGVGTAAAALAACQPKVVEKVVKETVVVEQKVTEVQTVVATAAPQARTVKVWWEDWGQVYNDLMKPIGNAYQEEHPNVTVEWSFLPQWREKFLTALAAGDVPDATIVRPADLAGLGFKRPWMAAALTFFLLSLTGIQLTSGFVGKLYVFGAAVREGYVWLAIVAVLNSVVSAFYYLHLVVIMYMREPAGAMEAQDSGWLLRLGLVTCTVGVLVLGLVPGPALEWAQQAVALVLR